MKDNSRRERHIACWIVDTLSPRCRLYDVTAVPPVIGLYTKYNTYRTTLCPKKHVTTFSTITLTIGVRLQ